MSLQQGSFSITRYRVLGREKRFTVPELNQHLHGYQLGPILLQKAPRELNFGWVLPQNPELEDKAERQQSWDISDCLFEDGILLRIRIERKSVSSQLLQAIMLQRWQESQTFEGGPEPQRVRKKQIQDEVKDELLQMSLPSVSYLDAYWRDQDDVVYLFSQSKMARDCFEELFRKTFCEPLELSLFRVLPPLLGLRPDAWQTLPQQAQLLEKLTHTLPQGSQDLSVS